MSYTKQKIIEYANLAKKCYYISESEIKSRNLIEVENGWKIIYCKKGTWDTLYVLYANKSKKELVLGIRGTNEIYNILTNAGLVLGVLTGRHQNVPGQSEIEEFLRILKNTLNEDFYFKSINNDNDDNDEYNLFKELNKSLFEFDRNFASISNELILTSICNSVSKEEKKHDNEKEYYKKFIDYKTIKILKDCESKENEGSIQSLKSSLSELINFYNYDLKIVGHSLGGVLAELCSVSCNLKCVTFDSPGSKEILDQIDKYKNKRRDIITFLSAPNIINTLNNHSGKIYRIKIPHTNGNFSLIHGVNCVSQSALRVLTYASPLSLPVSIYALTKAKLTTAAVSTIYNSVFIGGFSTISLISAPSSFFKDIEWLKNQHSIDNIYYQLQKENIQIIEMISWPNLYWSKTEYLMNNFKFFLPLRKDQAGIRNLIDEEGMREEQVKNMQGYQEFQIQQNNIFHNEFFSIY